MGRLYALMDQWCVLFDLEPIVIDLVGTFQQSPGQFPHVVHNLDEALKRFSDHSWVFMDVNGDVILDELAHPPDPTVYALGSDKTCFGRPAKDLPGTTVRLRAEVGNIYVHNVLPLILYDRYLYFNGRRK